MERAIAHFPRDDWPSELAEDGVTLNFDNRHRRRIRLCTDGGEDIFCHVSEIVDGNALVIESQVTYDPGMDDRTGKNRALNVAGRFAVAVGLAAFYGGQRVKVGDATLRAMLDVPNTGLESLSDDVHAALGIVKARNFSGHITLARLGGAGDSANAGLGARCAAARL